MYNLQSVAVKTCYKSRTKYLSLEDGQIFFATSVKHFRCRRTKETGHGISLIEIKNGDVSKLRYAHTKESSSSKLGFNIKEKKNLPDVK